MELSSSEQQKQIHGNWQKEPKYTEQITTVTMNNLTLDPESREILLAILKKSIPELTVNDIGFLKARRDYLTEQEKQQFASVLGITVPTPDMSNPPPVKHIRKTTQYKKPAKEAAVVPTYTDPAQPAAAPVVPVVPTVPPETVVAPPLVDTKTQTVLDRLQNAQGQQPVVPQPPAEVVPQPPAPVEQPEAVEEVEETDDGMDEETEDGPMI